MARSRTRSQQKHLEQVGYATASQTTGRSSRQLTACALRRLAAFAPLLNRLRIHSTWSNLSSLADGAGAEPACRGWQALLASETRQGRHPSGALEEAASCHPPTRRSGCQGRRHDNLRKNVYILYHYPSPEIYRFDAAPLQVIMLYHNCHDRFMHHKFSIHTWGHFIGQ